MAVPFGFSIGDFIAGINIILTSVRAVRDGRGSAADYGALVSELESLEAGLSAIDNLRLQATASKEHTAIKQATYRCQLGVESFVQTVAGYQRWLEPGVHGLRANLRKIQWAICKKDDVKRFRSQLERHSSSINTLLATLQVRQNQDLALLQDGCQQVAITTRDGVGNLQIGQETHNELIKDLTTQQTQLFQALWGEIGQLREALNLQAQIPAQVPLQSPVVLLDACGRVAPFHLDFISSAEAFLAVLRIRFKQSGVTVKGLQKLDNAEYIFWNQRTEVSLQQPWDTVFKPGQRVDMSMVFRQTVPMDTCPGCHCENAVQECGETQW